MHPRLRLLRARILARLSVPFALVGLVLGVSPLTSAVSAHATGTMQTYIVLYSAAAVPSDAAATIASAGGSLVYSYGQIGVAIARSDSTTFRTDVMKDTRIENAASTAGFATKLPDEQAPANDASGPPPGNLPNAPASDTDSLSPLQWDMRQIHTPEAHAITGGSPLVLAGDIDTGIDFNHPDLRQNIDVVDSVNCLTGAPVPGLAAQDDNGHGTHTAGTIAAASNGIGIVGVAPNIKIAAIKAGDFTGTFFPQAVVCAFVWAGTHHVDVTNNSYFADPFLFNCRNDPVQRAIWKAEQRAIRFAMQQGTVVVAADGNQSEDLAHPTMDVTSPDFPPNTAVSREVTNACVVIPVEISGVIGVSGDGNNPQLDKNGQPNGYLKSFFSSFGVGATQVVAPGGDSVFGRSPQAPNGRVLSTWPPNIPCRRSVKESGPDPEEPTVVYCYAQGTSMASPHVAGVAALIISRFGNLNNPQNGKMRPDQVQAYIDQTADPQPCPGSLPGPNQFSNGLGYLDFTGVDDNQVQSCQGGTGYNSWYGNGQVNALKAITHTPSN